MCTHQSSIWRSLTLIIAITSFSMNTVIASLFVFFPVEAQQKGASESTIGVINAIPTMGLIVFSLFLPALISAEMKKWFFVVGIIISSVCTILFGVNDYSPYGWQYNTLCVLIQMILGMGSACISSTALPLAIACFPNKSNSITAWVSFMSGIGSIIGSFLGTILFNIFGYVNLFIIIGSFCLITSFIAIVFVTDYSHPEYIELDDYGDIDSINLSTVKFLKYLFYPETILVSLSLFATGYVAGFVGVILGPWLVSWFHVAASDIGMFVLPMSITLTFSPFLASFIIGKGFVGYILIIASLSLIAAQGCWLLPYYSEEYATLLTIEVGLGLFGIAAGFFTVGMYLIYEKIAIRRNYLNMQINKVMVATTLNIILTLGYVVGPSVFGGWLNQYFGVKNTMITLLIIQVISLLILIPVLWKNDFFFRTYYNQRTKSIVVNQFSEICELSMSINIKHFTVSD